MLRELGITPWVTAPEPNTWRDLLGALDSKAKDHPLIGCRVAVQEYGVANPQLLDGLRSRGARVISVPVYRWALPDDLEPLRTAARAVAEGAVDVTIFTTAMQVVHLLQVAEGSGLHAQVRDGLGLERRGLHWSDDIPKSYASRESASTSKPAIQRWGVSRQGGG